MYKKYYVKHTPHRHTHHQSPIQTLLQYLFFSASSVVVVLLILLFNPFNILSLQNLSTSTQTDIPEVQGVSTVAPTETPIPTSVPTVQQVIVPSPTPTPLKKKSYRVAVYGDSMEDTMGELLEYMDHALKKKYPNNTFGLYNYGIGSQNGEDGLARFNKEFAYQTRRYPPIAEVHPDIIIMGSFAYNPFTPYDRDRHWLALTHLVQEAQKTGAKVYMIAEIAPSRTQFGKGPNGVNWSDNTIREHSGHIVEGLENAVGLSQALHIPLINVYEASKKANGQADSKYINPSDGIHPSVEGHEFTADQIVNTITFD